MVQRASFKMLIWLLTLSLYWLFLPNRRTWFPNIDAGHHLAGGGAFSFLLSFAVASAQYIFRFHFSWQFQFSWACLQFLLPFIQILGAKSIICERECLAWHLSITGQQLAKLGLSPPLLEPLHFFVAQFFDFIAFSNSKSQSHLAELHLSW